MVNLDLLGLIALICIWALLSVNQILVVAGYIYYIKVSRQPPKTVLHYPFVSILVPAHNEARVIVQNVESLLLLNYPPESYEIIVINDNSSDNSRELLENIQRRVPHRALRVINTDKITGGKGKSNALNIGFRQCKGEYIAVYDADNTPEADALIHLIAEIENDDTLGAVIGKFRTRNRDVNLLTRFINIETLSFQWMAQAGRWQLFNLCTIPGTNFVIRRSILDGINGWDEKAMAEDTELSFRIYALGYKIKLVPLSVTWEQEPQTLKVWFKQRVRWVKGNLYVLIKNFPALFKFRQFRVKFDVLYFMSVYFLLLGALIISDTLFLLNALGLITLTLANLSGLLWLMAIFLFVITVFITLTTEKGEMRFSNLMITVLMYFTYSKLWMVVAAYGLMQYLIDMVFKRGFRWYKTERF
jgi:cellulose synthase/poly-beta-1,6-N-acetylglucosamine synthase-like glycosyltransferase